MPSQKAPQKPMQIQKPAANTPALPPPLSIFQTIICTALPAGVRIVSGQPILRLHVHIAPRLQVRVFGKPVSPTLQMFPDFANWPGNFGPNGLAFTVQFRNNQATVVASVPSVHPAISPDAALWQYLVPSSMPVISYVPDIQPNTPPPNINTYPSQQVYSAVRQVYTGIAIESPTHLPAVQRILDPKKGFGPMAMLPPVAAPKGPVMAAAQARFVNTQRNHAQLLSQHKVIPGNVVDPALAFYQLDLYNKPRNPMLPLSAMPPQKNGPTTVPYPQPAVADMNAALTQLQQSMDFHKLVSFLGSYPALQQRLGLVLELDFPIPANLPASGTVQVLPQWKPATATTSVTPATFYDLTSTTFLAHPTALTPTLPPQLVQKEGMLNLQSSAYQLYEVDVAQAGIGVQNTVQNLLRQENQSPNGTPSSGALPTLRSAGLAVHFVGRADWARAKYTSMQNYEASLQANGAFPQPLSADDLTRGYRVDVQEATSGTTGPWFSLCQRLGNYTFASVPNGSPLRNWLNVPDESYVQLATTKASVGLPMDVFLGERMFRWLGWSLAVPRPGNTVDRDDTITGPNFNPNDPAGNPFGIGVKFQVPLKSLPRLRFGKTYRMRARAVDLAGYSLAPNDVIDPTLAAGPTTYFRFEPIDAPLLALTGPLSLGETASKMVIRSNYQQTVQQYSAAHPGFPSVCDRHIAPPVAAPETAEVLGMFDNMRPQDSYNLIASRQAMPAVDAKKNMIDAGQLMNIPYMTDPLSRGPAFFVDTLPDSQPIPLTAKSVGPLNGAAPFSIDFYPGTSSSTSGTALGPAWSNPVPLRFRIVDPAAIPNPTWDANARVLSIPVPQGQTLTLHLSSYPTAADLDKIMGLWDWIKSGGQASSLLPSALQGLQYMLTPYQEITLVHAVQQPLVIPNLQNLNAIRQNFGDTEAWLTCKFPIDGNSTAKVDFMAEWHEPVDDLSDHTNKMPNTVNGKAHACDLSLVPQVSAVDLLPYDPMNYPDLMRRQQFHDTKYRKVTYTAVATSRYQDYFPQTVGPFTQASPPQMLDVLSSARPAAPKVLYVIPSFDWQTTGSGSSTTRQRLTGLRVYLERPWYSSGDGELLGVVLWPNTYCPTAPPPCPPLPPIPKPPGGNQGQGDTGQGGTSNQFSKQRVVHWTPSPTIKRLAMSPQSSGGGGGKPGQVNVPIDVPPPMQKYVTQWGLDPVWRSNPVTDVPGMGDFKNAVASGTCLTIEELQGLMLTGKVFTPPEQYYEDAYRVCVVGFPVSYDQTRQLWFCDIAIDPQASYFPFIRLALARFQPNSVSGFFQYGDCSGGQGGVSPYMLHRDCCLSHVVQADFVQITPNRTLSLAPIAGSNSLHVTLAGITYAASSALPTAQTSLVEVSLETQPNGSSDDAGWTPVANSQQVLKFSQNPPNAIWQGQVNLPAARGTQQFRLVIKEYERLMADANTDIPATRLVYADAVVI